ncbi:MAG: hypothetical protein ACE5Q6_02600 [Dehalococcoidia bacterium]
MRDGINLERVGVPAIVVSHEVFEKAARAQSQALGLAELRLIIYPQPKGIEHEVEGAESARIITDQLLTLLRDASV